MAKRKEWSPLEDAKEHMEGLKSSIDKCKGDDVAIYSAVTFGNIEAAFCGREIDEDTMVVMKEDVRRLIHRFDQKCKCEKRI